jgi:hypothetical protein
METYNTKDIGLAIFLMLNGQRIIRTEIMDPYLGEIETVFKTSLELPYFIESYLSGNAKINAKRYGDQLQDIIQFFVHHEEYPLDEINY